MLPHLPGVPLPPCKQALREINEVLTEGTCSGLLYSVMRRWDRGFMAGAISCFKIPCVAPYPFLISFHLKISSSPVTHLLKKTASLKITWKESATDFALSATRTFETGLKGTGTS